MSLTNFDYLFKIVIIGDQGVGKSSLLLRYADHMFSSHTTSTIGVDFKIKTLTVRGYTVKLQIWDTAGQEKFRNITTSYYRGAHGIILVFDAFNEQSFHSLNSWLQEVQRYMGDSPQVKKLLIGNKADLAQEGRPVSREMIKRFVDQYGLPYLETSAKTDLNVDKVFCTIAEALILQEQGKSLPELDGSRQTTPLRDSFTIEFAPSGQGAYSSSFEPDTPRNGGVCCW